MDPVSKKQSSGVALVFVLMALIAVLALGVVFLSRMTREEREIDAGPADAGAVTTGTEEAAPAGLASEPELSTATEALEPAPEPVVPPPPPPPVNTPDTRNLPPEG